MALSLEGMSEQLPAAITNRHDIVDAVLVEAFLETMDAKRGRRFLDILERLTEHQVMLARKNVVRIRSNGAEDLPPVRMEAVARLRIIIELGRRILLSKAA